MAWQGAEDDHQKLERLLSGYKLLQDDFNDLRSDFQMLLQCLESQKIVESQKFAFSKDHHQQDVLQDTTKSRVRLPVQTFASVMSQKTLAERIFSAAGQVAWSSTRRVSKNGLLHARAVEREKIVVLGGSAICYPRSTRDVVRSMEVLDVQTDKWEVPMELPDARVCSSALELGGYIYLAGGWEDTVVRFYPSASAHGKWDWSPLPRMRAPRHSCELAALNGYLYVIGGHCELNQMTLNWVERLNPRKAGQEWERIRGMKWERRACVAVTLGDKIYVSGGSNKSPCSTARPNLDIAQSAEVLEDGGTFMPISKMNVGRIHHAGAAVKGKMVVTGGIDPSKEFQGNTTEMFDPSNNTWTLTLSMRLAMCRGGHVATVAAGKLYLLGGGERDRHPDDEALATVDRFDFQALAWEQRPRMGRMRIGAAGATVKVGPGAAP